MKGKGVFKTFAAALLAVLGFASCEKAIDVIDDGGGLCMYGQPHADFKAVGTVKDKSGKPIEGIRVAVQQHRHYENSESVIYDQNDWYDNDTLFTDVNGQYELVRSVFDAPNRVTVVFEDIDGEENGGEFAKAEANPKVVQTKKGDKSWYGGAFQVEADAKLNKK